MEYEKIILNRERNVTLTAMVQGVGGEFRGIEARPAVLVIPGGGRPGLCRAARGHRPRDRKSVV